VKYAFPQLDSKTRFQTYNIVARTLLTNGHSVTPDIEDDSDAVLFSACDALDMVQLRQLMKKTDKPIILGGSYAFNFWSASTFADIVWIGEVFEFAELKTLADIADHRSAYTGTPKQLFASQRIDWERVPITQISKNKCYYWGGVGCKNKCRFCFTSWTHKHQVNSNARISSAIATARKRGIHLMISANEYTDDIDVKTKDMLLRDYIKKPVKGALVRLGVEFATERVREKIGKPITRNELFAAIQKMNVDNVALKLFHIAGYESRDDWEQYILDLCEMVTRSPNKRLLHLEFNNLQYQNYTPLYRERHSIDPDKYIDISTTKRWFDILRQHSSHVLVGAPSPFKHVASRMVIELGTTREIVNSGLTMLAREGKHTNEEYYKLLIDSGVLNTPAYALNFQTGEIKRRAESDHIGVDN